MLKPDTLDKLIATLKLDKEKFTAALNDKNEVDFELPALSVFTPDELKIRDENIKKERYSEGKTAGSEIAVKEFKEKFGITIEGKNLEAVVEAVKTKILEEAKIEPNKQLQEKEKAIEALRATITAVTGEKTALEDSIKSMRLEARIVSEIPDGIIGKDEVLGLMKIKGYSFDEENGAIIPKLNGEKILNNLQSPEAIKTVAASFMTERKLIADESGGRGGRGGKSDKTGDNVKTIADLREQFEKDGKSLNGQEFAARCMELSKDNPDFFNE
jgi:hypothetical protein